MKSLHTILILMDLQVIQIYTSVNPKGFDERYVPTSVATNFDLLMCVRTMSVPVSLTLSISSQLTINMLRIINFDINTIVAPSVQQSSWY